MRPNVPLTFVLVCCLSVAAQGRSETILDGFTIEPWLTNAGDIRGVTVGPGGDFGYDPYVYSRTLQSVIRVTDKEHYEVFATGFGSGTGRIVFDPSEQFNGDMFVAGIFDRAGPDDPIYRITSSGSSTVFYQSSNSNLDLLMKGLSFGKGTAFGDDLYVMDFENQCLQRLTASGNQTPFGGGVFSASWEDDMVLTTGGAFGNYAYMTDGIGHRLFHMSPTGTTEQFASNVTGAMSLAIGSGAFGEYLYVGTVFGDVYRVDSEGGTSLFASGFGLLSPEGNFRGMDISGDAMWLTSDTGTLYRITPSSPVPEPSTLAMCLGLGGMGLVAARRRRRRAA